MQSCLGMHFPEYSIQSRAILQDRVAEEAWGLALQQSQLKDKWPWTEVAVNSPFAYLYKQITLRKYCPLLLKMSAPWYKLRSLLTAQPCFPPCGAVRVPRFHCLSEITEKVIHVFYILGFCFCQLLFPRSGHRLCLVFCSIMCSFV